MRKTRSDKNHIIYQITNKITSEFYLGLTILRGRAYIKSVKKRFKQHESRAKNENREWNLYKSINQYGIENFTIEIIEVIRGKASAHTREIELIKNLKPQLNTASC